MLSNMEPDSTESHSLLTQGNSLYTSSTSLGYYSTSHATNLEEAIDNFTFGQKSNNHLDITSSEFMEGTPLQSKRSINSIDNQEFKSTTNPTPFAHPIVSYGYECLPYDSSSKFSNELSLSLATSEPSIIRDNRQLVSENTYSCSSGAHSLSFDSYKELQVLPSLLSRSRFVQAMQEILAEIAFHALENIGPVIYPSNYFSRDDLRNRVSKKKCLLNLLQAVDERYKQCMDEIHKVTSAFHAVTELDPNLHARFAFATISFVYKNLRERISSHILEMGSCLISEREEEREDESFETCFIQKQLALQQIVSKRDHRLWRPQRGLPESSVSVLRSWMFQNFLHPYPKDAEKHLLALKSGLTRNQVSNWFINARVRIWKPMIEEMYAEMNKRKARRSNAETERNRRNQITCALRMEDLLGNDHG